ncbi:acyl-CoA carboxylase subunit epsilon [Amycolatopsis sp. NPDC051071]|uniref:acyl-CoA carboxylase subunit epsilon n=1 Tax=Amycolatopsis sp. NPDC051071 TaxID=3154637 RepID=UPI0034404705
MADATVRVLRGSPDDDEVAALIAVLSALGAAPRPAVREQPRPRPRLVPFRVATSWRALRTTHPR